MLSLKRPVWGIITHGDKVVNKPKKDYTQDDYNILQLNVRARYIITCALSKTKYNKFCRTKDVQLRKVVAFMRHYKMFTKKDDETIDEIFGKFQTILNGLSSLGYEFSKAQNNLKILDSLLKLSSKDPLALKTRETSSRKEEKCLKVLKVETSNA
ncbi:hypothetical protein CR513_25905, partial [Mucuna pruriens]